MSWSDFRGEDEEAFENTYRLIEELPVAFLHVFPYSKRPGTPAAAMKGQVREEEKKARAERLRRLGQEKNRDFLKRFLGKPLEVLLESRSDKKTGLLKGFSRQYMTVLVENSESGMANSVVSVLAVGVCDEGIIGRIIGENVHDT